MKILKIVFNFLIYMFSFIIPKSKKYVIIGGWHGERYADNSRAMFEYLNEKKSSLGIVKVFWYTKNKDIYESLKSQGRDVLYGYNIKSIFWHFRSKVHIIDQSTRDIIAILSVRCIRIDLWHGIPLKKIGNYIHGENASSWKDKCYTAGCWPDKYVLATSDFVAQMLRYAMGIKEEKMIIASYPRTNELYKSLPNYYGNRKMNVFYLPTFRDENDINPLLLSDINEIDKKLMEKQIFLYIKPHFASAASWEDANKLHNIKILDSKEDVYSWLNDTDLLITDYSSVYFDYLITGRPIIFYPYDLNNYCEFERGFTMSYKDNTPGKKVYSVDELLETIFYIRDNYFDYIEEYSGCYEQIKHKVYKFINEPDYSELDKFWQ